MYGFRGSGAPLRPGPEVAAADPSAPPPFLPSLYTPRYLFNGDWFPTYLSGAGYLLPRAALPCLFAEAMRLPYVHVEDVFLNGFAASRYVLGSLLLFLLILLLQLLLLLPAAVFASAAVVTAAASAVIVLAAAASAATVAAAAESLHFPKIPSDQVRIPSRAL